MLFPMGASGLMRWKRGVLENVASSDASLAVFCTKKNCPACRAAKPMLPLLKEKLEGDGSTLYEMSCDYEENVNFLLTCVNPSEAYVPVLLLFTESGLEVVDHSTYLSR